MQAYILRRVSLIIPTLLLVTVIVFLLSRLIPGSIVDFMLDQQGWTSESTTGIEVTRAELEKRLGLDVPIHIQYGRWIGKIVRGDFGKSLWTNRRVIDEMADRLPVSLELGVLALIIGQVVAIPVGIISAVRQDTISDYSGRTIAILFLCVPGFWLGIMVMVYPAIWWNWSPSVTYVSFLKNPLQNLQMFIVPAAIMGLHASGTTMRMTRSMMLEVLRQDYIRTAWSKGLKERVVVMRHALKNALIPVVTIVGMGIPVLVAGTVIMEQIFNLPGMGRLMIEALTTRDYTMLSGVNLFIASFVMLNNLVVDLSYAYLDPRIRYR